MSGLVKILLSAALLLSIVIPFCVFICGERSRGRYKKALLCNALLFFGILFTAGLLLFNGQAYASGEMAGAAAASSKDAGLGYIAAALAVGLSGIGGGLAVSAAASSALGAISEDQSILGKSLIFVGLAEGVCLYGLIIAFMILVKL